MKYLILGSTGMAGSAFKRRFDIDQIEYLAPSHSELDLTDQREVKQFFSQSKFDVVILAAAMVGGISANSKYPVDYIYNNLMIQTNVINSAWSAGIQKAILLASSCIYPKFSNQPIKESDLLSGYLEPTNEPFAVAKISGIKLCESYNIQYGTDYRTVMATNLYGPGDNYNPEQSHALPAMIRRFHEAKISNAKDVIIWGTGNPLREFLYIDDLVDASLHLLNVNNDLFKSITKPLLSHINVGSGEEISIRDLANLIASTVGYSGNIIFDTDKPDGMPRKRLDISLMNGLGWKSSIMLQDGVKATYDSFLHSSRL